MFSALTVLKPSSLYSFLCPKDHMTLSHDNDREDGWKSMNEGPTVRQGLGFPNEF